MNKIQQEIKIFHDKLEPILEKFWNNIIRKIQRKLIIRLLSPAKSSFRNVHTEVFQILVVCVLSHIGFIFTEIKNLRWRFVKLPMK